MPAISRSISDAAPDVTIRARSGKNKSQSRRHARVRIAGRSTWNNASCSSRFGEFRFHGEVIPASASDHCDDRRASDRNPDELDDDQQRPYRLVPRARRPWKTWSASTTTP